MDDLPTEIKEIIIYFCDGESLFNLRRVNQNWKILVDQEDKRRNLFKRCLKTDIDKNTLKDLIMKMFPKKNCLYSDQRLFKTVFYASLRWKYFSNNQFTIDVIPHIFSDVIDLKVSGSTILIGDKRGLYVMHSLNEPLIFHDIGRVKNIELYCISSSSKNGNIAYDAADIMTENSIHCFYNLNQKKFKKRVKYLEKKLIKYWNGKAIEFDVNELPNSPIIKADFYENYIMIVTKENVIRSKDSNLLKVHKDLFNCDGGRAWLLWHSKLLICAKDDSLNVFVDGKTRIVEYSGFSPVTSIFYYAGWLFLGSKYGLLYGYHIRSEDIISIDLEEYNFKLKICNSALVKIDVIEKKNLSLIVASDKQIFLLRCTKEVIN